MTDERATGLILRTYPLTETSLIIHWLTREQGRLATVAKGARRPKSPFRGKLDLYFLADFSFLRSRRSQLHTLREIVLRDTHPALRTDIACLQQAAYGSGLIEKFTETDTPLPGCFQLFSDWLRLLSQPRPPKHTALIFETKLLVEFGLAPDPRQTPLSAGAKAVLQKWIEADWAALERLCLSEDQQFEIEAFLGRFLAQQLGQLLPTRAHALHPLR